MLYLVYGVLVKSETGLKGIAEMSKSYDLNNDADHAAFSLTRWEEQKAF